MTAFEKQKLFNKRMITDYQKGLLPPIFTPYFEWKIGVRNLYEISQTTIKDMLREAHVLLESYYGKYPDSANTTILLDPDNSIWNHYQQFGKDKYIVSYLEAIDGELNNLQCFLLSQKKKNN